jgi:hypothetical protein
MLVVHNAKIYTLDPTNTIAEALAIENGRIVAAGKSTSLLSEYGGRPGAQRLDLSGSTVLPGLCDAHIHLENFARSLTKIDCETTMLQECLDRVSQQVLIKRPGEWILGHGWNQTNWPEGFPNAQMLDRITTAHPVYLTAKSLHAGWANSTALKLAGIQATTQDPSGGRIGRKVDGQPDGILYESAMSLLDRSIPEPDTSETARLIKTALKYLIGLGITSVHDFDQRTCFLALQQLHHNGSLPIRVTKSLPYEDLEHALALGLTSGFGDDFLRIGNIKAFSDGALGPRTAAMLQPYEGEPENRGMLLLDAEELTEKGRRAIENGLGLTVHAIGDRANHEVLSALSQLRADEHKMILAGKLPNRRLRHRIEHVQIIHEDDIGLIAKIGVIASMQPIHATSDMLMADRYWGMRTNLSYAWRTHLDTGARLAFGSDAPVESPNPFWGLHAAVTRQRQDGSPAPLGWHPEQRLTLFEALQGYTTGPAYATYMETSLGSLQPGFLADLIALDQDPFTCSADALKDLLPWLTMVNGQVIRNK